MNKSTLVTILVSGLGVFVGQFLYAQYLASKSST